ncbi:STAS domain-containing protein [Streptomyces sp. NPDC006259]|uniref:STAS domain-containing protein n=1 Tax=Streptomyces sp. NPDC006259 TaxID=3364740 RepID=UPI0036902E0C
MSTDQPARGREQASLEVRVRTVAAGRHLVTAAGTLDIRTAPQLSEVLQPLLEADGHTVLADLSGVTFLDSTGLTCLIAGYRTTRITGARLALIAPSERVRHMLALTGTDQVLRSYPTTEAAPD